MTRNFERGAFGIRATSFGRLRVAMYQYNGSGARQVYANVNYATQYGLSYKYTIRSLVVRSGRVLQQVNNYMFGG